MPTVCTYLYNIRKTVQFQYNSQQNFKKGLACEGFTHLLIPARIVLTVCLVSCSSHTWKPHGFFSTPLFLLYHSLNGLYSQQFTIQRIQSILWTGKVERRAEQTNNAVVSVYESHTGLERLNMVQCSLKSHVSNKT